MIVSIMQPAYLPWPGYFDRIAMSDLHVVLDHVAIDRNSKTKFANRNKLRVRDGWCWVTVPLVTKGRSDELQLNQLEIDNSSNWRHKHWSTIEVNYARARYMEEHRSFLRSIYSREWRNLTPLVQETSDYLRSALAISTPVVYSSSLGITSHKDELIVDICRAVSATEYVSGPFGRDYLREPLFESAGIKLRYHDYTCPNYAQVFSGFEPCMSALDILLNCGPESSSVISSTSPRSTE